MGRNKSNWLRARTGAGLGILLVGVAMILVSCYPGGPTDVAELDTVITVYSKDADFKANKTYAMPDFIPFLCPDDGTCDSTLLDRSNDALVLQLVADNLKAYGYERITVIDTINGPIPDVVVVCSVTSSNNWVAYSYPIYPGWGWWGGWGYWGYPGYGWGYPGGVAVTNYQTGSLFIDMVDPVNPNAATGEIPVLWDAALNGLLSGSSSGKTQRITNGINQAFKQSPYLDVN
jgi:hypothetical protein